MSKLKIKKGDTVVVITGEHKSADTQYKVLAVDPKSSRVTLEGITVKKHSKPTAKFPQGGIIDIPVSLHISNVKLIGSDGQPTRVGRRVDEKSGKLERYSIKSGEAIK
jgi:large subunit ribosomal protein L24